MGIELSVIWFVIIVFATLMYIVMDGFDLGIGLLFSTVRGGGDRDVMVNSVAPVWDGNETWLVLGGAKPVWRLSPRLRGDHRRPVDPPDPDADRPDFSRRRL